MNRIFIFLGRQIHFWLKPFIYFLTNNSTRSRVIIVSNHKVLLVKSYLSDNTWGFPGGGLKKNEDLIRGVLREVKEETNLDLDPKGLYFLGDYLDKLLFFKHYLKIYRYNLKENVKVSPQKYEISAINWFDLDELKNSIMLNSKNRQIWQTFYKQEDS